MLRKTPVQETKEQITALSKEIKDLKRELRGVPHQYPGSPYAQSQLSTKKAKVRGLFLLYAWFRGQRADQVQAPVRDPYDGNLQYAKYFAASQLETPELRELFSKWLSETLK